MQVGDSIDQHEDFDTDSLFGSPPPSPGRGRSSSPLALPGGQNSVQNVGTLALPGSHVQLIEHSENRALPPRVAARDGPHKPPRLPQPPVAVTAPKNPPRPRKRKRVATGDKSAKDDAPLDPNFLKDKEKILGIAGKIARNATV